MSYRPSLGRCLLVRELEEQPMDYSVQHAIYFDPPTP